MKIIVKSETFLLLMFFVFSLVKPETVQKTREDIGRNLVHSSLCLISYSVPEANCSENSQCKGYKYRAQSRPNNCQLIGPKDESGRTFVSSWEETIFMKDYCGPKSCKNEAVCRSEELHYMCICSFGFTGPQCETDINECESQPCNNDGSCVDRINSFSCQCSPGFTGSLCETDINECESEPCQNSGFCQDGNNSYNCDCVVGFTGPDCETDINECESEPCLNDGTCQDSDNSFWCYCHPGFTGSLCETCLSVWLSPVGWNKSQPSFYLDFEDRDCLIVSAAASLDSAKVGNGIVTTGEVNAFANLGEITTLTCFVDPETCTSGGTLAVWIRIHGSCTSDAGGIITSQSDKNSRGFTVYCTTQRIHHRVHQRNGRYEVEVYGIPSGWFHLTMVIPASRTSLSVYHNVVHKGTDRSRHGTSSSSPQNVIIGYFYNNANTKRYGPVIVDELMMWDEQLEENDILMVYNSC